jgi:hypothetical protein
LVDDLASDMIYQLIEGPEGDKDEILATVCRTLALLRRLIIPLPKMKSKLATLP